MINDNLVSGLRYTALVVDFFAAIICGFVAFDSAVLTPNGQALVMLLAALFALNFVALLGDDG